ncbi:MAG: phosphoglycerate dehydrogenase [Methanothrix sp.]|uniref:phosphoglycerate dehydrogenase n=1 Tax=Methanothrix sp. TaxID=90426 RepID=UPI0032AF2C2A|nr:phosphoglycerate dehydrogenase [Methanothrix sp.]
MRVLVSDPLAEEGIRRLETAAEVDVITNLTPEELVERIKGYDALVIRSGTKVTADVINAADRLKVIARAGVGVDNVDVDAATKKGIIVVNAPGGNTISAAEHTIAMMLALARNIPQAHASVKRGEWNRKKYTGVEVFNKTLGIIGLGRIGTEVAKRMKAFGMRILAYDPFITESKAAELGIKLASLEEIYRESDFITVHTPLTPETRNMIDEPQIKMMKPTVRLINCARGGIINEAALARAVAENRIAGAAVDVYTKEPPVGNPLIEQERIITTPHLGASTAEAQINVALAVADQIIAISRGQLPTTAINLISIPPETMAVMEPYMDIAERMGRLLGQLGTSRFEQLEIVYGGSIAEKDTRLITIAAVKGLLSAIGAHANLVNSLTLLKEKGVKLIESKTEVANGYSNLITMRLKTASETFAVHGTVYRPDDRRIVQINDYRVHVPTEGNLVLVLHEDRPNIIGPVCVVLGEANINIGSMHVGRISPGQPQLMVLNVDSPVSDETLKRILSVSGVLSARTISM